LQAAVVLMSRAPVPGKTKTRLESHLKKEECAELHKAFLKDINAKFLNLKNKNARIDLYLSFTPKKEKDSFSGLISTDFIRIPQIGADLGEKMYNALNDAYQLSDLPVIITGSDLPLLDIEIFTEAFAGLKERDLVIGPSVDGGYYLIGMKKPQKFLFNSGTWGNRTVLQQTIKEASRHNLKIHFLPEASDVDTFKELLQLRSKLINQEVNLSYSKNTKAVIEKILSYK
jgi:rSAM/selenodomain-associated transferase 1